MYDRIVETYEKLDMNQHNTPEHLLIASENTPEWDINPAVMLQRLGLPVLASLVLVACGVPPTTVPPSPEAPPISTEPPISATPTGEVETTALTPELSPTSTPSPEILGTVLTQQQIREMVLMSDYNPPEELEILVQELKTLSLVADALPVVLLESGSYTTVKATLTFRSVQIQYEEDGFSWFLVPNTVSFEGKTYQPVLTNENTHALIPLNTQLANTAENLAYQLVEVPPGFIVEHRFDQTTGQWTEVLVNADGKPAQYFNRFSQAGPIGWLPVEATGQASESSGAVEVTETPEAEVGINPEANKEQMEALLALLNPVNKDISNPVERGYFTTEISLLLKKLVLDQDVQLVSFEQNVEGYRPDVIRLTLKEENSRDEIVERVYLLSANYWSKDGEIRYGYSSVMEESDVLKAIVEYKAFEALSRLEKFVFGGDQTYDLLRFLEIVNLYRDLPITLPTGTLNNASSIRSLPTDKVGFSSRLFYQNDSSYYYLEGGDKVTHLPSSFKMISINGYLVGYAVLNDGTYVVLLPDQISYLDAGPKIEHEWARHDRLVFGTFAIDSSDSD